MARDKYVPPAGAKKNIIFKYTKHQAPSMAGGEYPTHISTLFHLHCKRTWLHQNSGSGEFFKYILDWWAPFQLLFAGKSIWLKSMIKSK